MAGSDNRRVDRQARSPRGVVAFLLTDIEGSTRLWQAQPRTMPQLLERHDAILKAGIRAGGGRVLTERGEGDSFFAVFERASDAVTTARDLQLALQREDWALGAPIRVRMAINTGEAGGDYRGMAANRCARIRQLARGGQVLLSQATYALVRDNPPEGVALVDLGARRLRDVAGDEHVYEARWDAHGVAKSGPSQRVRLMALLGAPAVALVLAAAVAGYATGRLPPNLKPGSPRALPPAPPVDHLTITTVAGNGVQGYASGAIRATDAELDQPSGLAVDGSGDLFIADTGNNLVRELLPNGTLDTVAGGGTATDLPPGGRLGTELRLSGPTGLSYDLATGNLYIADTGDRRVVRLDTRGPTPADQDTAFFVAAVAGPTAAVAGPAGSVLDGVVIADALGGGVRLAARGTLKAPEFAGTAPALSSRGLPDVVVTSNGRLFVSNSGGNEVLVSDPLLKSPRALAGTGESGYDGDGGPANRALLSEPEGLAVDAWGRVYVSDAGNDVIRLIDPKTGLISTIAGDGAPGGRGDHGPALDAELDAPAAVAVTPSGRIYVADTGDARIRLLTQGPRGKPSRVITLGDSSLMAGLKLRLPASWYVDQDHSGSLVVKPLDEPVADQLVLGLNRGAVDPLADGNSPLPPVPGVGPGPSALIDWLTTNPSFAVVSVPQPVNLGQARAIALTVGVAPSARSLDPHCPTAPRCVNVLGGPVPGAGAYSIQYQEEVRLYFLSITTPGAAGAQTFELVLDATSDSDLQVLLGRAQPIIDSIRFPPGTVMG